MINILINTLKSTIDNKTYYPIILDNLYNEILKQYLKYYNNENVGKNIIFQYLDRIYWNMVLYYKDDNSKDYFKKQIDLNIKQLLNYLDKVKNGKYK